MKIHHKTLSVARLIHVYVSMALLTLLLFFSVTGITLNHPEWFTSHSPNVSESEWIIAPELLRDPPLSLSQLAVVTNEVERLANVNLSNSNIESDSDEIYFSLKKAGTNSSLSIDVVTGEVFYQHTDYGWWALLNDLHKGRNTSFFWGLIIDLTSVLFIVFAISGFILAMPQRRFHRTLTLGTSTTLLMAIVIGLFS